MEILAKMSNVDTKMKRGEVFKHDPTVYYNTSM